MSKRFFAADLAAAAGEIVLTDDEAHHLLAVCRARTGETFELFDGHGMVARARLLSATRKSARVELAESRLLPYRGLDLVLACPLPKGDRAAVLVEKCTELGVRRLVPLETERSVVEPGQGKLEKLRRTVIEACKQCGREHLLELSDPLPWPRLAETRHGSRWLLDPSGARAGAGGTAVPDLVAIGPEGGWSAAELALARETGWHCVSLPGFVLRIETAAVAFAAWLRLRTEV